MFSNVTGPPVGISYVEMAVKARKASYKALIDRETILCERYPYRVAEKGYGEEWEKRWRITQRLFTS